MARIEYQRLSGITYEQELEILAEVYRLALESHRKRKQKADEPTPEPDGRDRTKVKGDSADARIIRNGA
jgi:hypothetical protein